VRKVHRVGFNDVYGYLEGPRDSGRLRKSTETIKASLHPDKFL
jgi:hypothetical protein